MQRVAPDVSYLQTLIVNVFFVGPPDAGDREWVLIDAGIAGCARRIARAAEARFGAGARPAAIILTHGHFDHVGSLQQLAEAWDAPVYAHELELPYLTGRSSYPPGDPSVGGGAMAWSAPLYPRRPIDLGPRVHPLPHDGSLPSLPEWRWVHTPGHTPGHISLFRPHDRVLLAGDAFTTVKQESLTAVATQWQQIHGPPSYFTQDWVAARTSVQRLAALDPSVAATGHGIPMRGEELRQALGDLAEHFWHVAVPPDGRYVRQPAIAGPEGTVYVPPPTRKPPADLLVTLGVGIAATALALAAAAARREPRETYEAPPRREVGLRRPAPGLEPSRPSAGAC